MSNRCLQAAARRPVADRRCEARIGLSRSSRGGGYTYQYNQRGRNLTAALKNRSAIAQERSMIRPAMLCFSSTPRWAKQNHKKYQDFISPFVISRPSPPARHAHQAPLAHSNPSRHEASDAQTAPAESCSTTAHENFATFSENLPTFRSKRTTLRPPSPACDATRAAAHPLQSIIISCLHPSPLDIHS